MDHVKLNAANSSSSTTLLEQLEQINFHEIVDSLRANKILIFWIMALGLCCSLIYVSIRPPLYMANVVFQVDDNPQNNLASLGGNAAAGASMGFSSTTSPIEVQSVLIKSSYVLAPVIQKLGLDLKVEPDYFPIFGKYYAEHTHNKELAPPLFGMSGFNWGGQHLHVAEFRVDNNTLEPRFTLVALSQNHYALYDAQNNLILKGIVGVPAVGATSAYGMLHILIQELSANPHAHFFIQQKHVQGLISNLIKDLQLVDLADVNNTPVRGPTGILQLSLEGGDPAYLVNILNTIAEITVAKNIEKKSAETERTLEFLNKEVPALKQSLNDSEMALSGYLAEHKMADMTSEIKLLVGQLSEAQKNLELIRMVRAQASQEYTVAHPYIQGLNEKEKILTNEIGLLQDQISKLPTKDQEIIKLTRDVRVKNQLYLSLLNQMQTLQVSKAGDVSNIQILTKAQMPEGPQPFSKWLICLEGVFLGFIVGCFIVLARAFLYRKLSDPIALERQFGLSNLAIVPYSEKQHELILTYKAQKAVIPMLAALDPKNLSVEALRSLRTSLKFATLEAKNNIITIIGIAPGVGKSFISANFAYLMASADQKILLIDGDIRKGHLRDYFVSGYPQGLTEVISGACTFAQAVITHPTSPNLHFLSTGKYPPNPSELLMSSRFKEFLAEVAKGYDLVIVDTAPILAVTDGAIIAQEAGANFMVVASDMHESEEVKLALKRFASNHVRINGVVFNFSKPNKGLYRSRHAHQYGKYQYKYE